MLDQVDAERTKYCQNSTVAWLPGGGGFTLLDAKKFAATLQNDQVQVLHSAAQHLRLSPCVTEGLPPAWCLHPPSLRPWPARAVQLNEATEDQGDGFPPWGKAQDNNNDDGALANNKPCEA